MVGVDSRRSAVLAFVKKQIREFFFSFSSCIVAMAMSRSAAKQLKCSKLESSKLAYTNLVYLSPADFRALRVQNGKEVKHLTVACENSSVCP